MRLGAAAGVFAVSIIACNALVGLDQPSSTGSGGAGGAIASASSGTASVSSGGAGATTASASASSSAAWSSTSDAATASSSATGGSGGASTTSSGGAASTSVTTIAVAATASSSSAAASSSSGLGACAPSGPGVCCYSTECDGNSSCCVKTMVPFAAMCSSIPCGASEVVFACDSDQDCGSNEICGFLISLQTGTLLEGAKCRATCSSGDSPACIELCDLDNPMCSQGSCAQTQFQMQGTNAGVCK